jgi:hypothetical protein
MAAHQSRFVKRALVSFNTGDYIGISPGDVLRVAAVLADDHERSSRNSQDAVRGDGSGRGPPRSACLRGPIACKRIGANITRG